MTNKLEAFSKIQLKTGLPEIAPGDTVIVSQKIKEGGKRKAETFEGLVLARKHGKGISATITVRRVVLGIGVEKVFPIHSPNIEKIEIIKKGKTRRAKLYYMREAKGKDAKLKRKEDKIKIPGDSAVKAKTEEKQA